MASDSVMMWASEELIPLLKFVFGESLHGTWDQRIRDVSQTVDILRVYEDFPSTIERVRLLLVNPEIMTTAEVKNFGWIRREIDMCIGVFVRHAMKHGTYKLASLGTEPDPDYPRRKLSEAEKDGYVFGGKFAAVDPEVLRKREKREKERGELTRGMEHRTSRGGHQGTFRNFRGGDVADRGGRQGIKKDIRMGKSAIQEEIKSDSGPVQKPSAYPAVFRHGQDGAASAMEVTESSLTKATSKMENPVLRPEADEFVPGA